ATSSHNRSHISPVFPYRSPQKVSFRSRTKCWNCSVIGATFAMGCKLLFKDLVLASEAKTNLHPPHFYTPEFTSPASPAPSAVIRHIRQFIIRKDGKDCLWK